MAQNWKIDTDYDYVADLNAAGWGFEFLRRNPEYQADYKTVMATEAALAKQYGPYEDNSWAWRQDARAWVWEPHIKADETHKDWERRTALTVAQPERTPLREWHMNRWGLVDQFPDPSCQADPAPEFNSKGRFPLFPKYDAIGDFFEGDDYGWEQSDGSAVVVFDLWGKLDEQIAAAKVQLVARAKQQMEEEEKKAKEGGYKAQPQLKGQKPGDVAKRLRKYLRTLDAVAAGAKPKMVEEIIHGNEDNSAASGYAASKRGKEKIDQAKKYSEWRYLLIRPSWIKLPS